MPFILKTIKDGQKLSKSKNDPNTRSTKITIWKNDRFGSLFICSSYCPWMTLLNYLSNFAYNFKTVKLRSTAIFLHGARKSVFSCNMIGKENILLEWKRLGFLFWNVDLLDFYFKHWFQCLCKWWLELLTPLMGV